MLSDWIFVVGVILFLIAVAGLVSAYVDRYLSVPMLVLTLVAAVMVAGTCSAFPDRYASKEAPMAFYRVAGDIMHGRR